jgi:hypothetical protein
MSTATDGQTPRKRTRISDDVEVINPTTSHKKNDYNLYKGPLASLQPVIRPIIDVYFARLTDLFNKYVANKTKLQKFDDTNFIPKSCRVNFTAGGSSLIKGSTEYSELLAQIDNQNKATASHHCDAVKKVINLEKKIEIKPTTFPTNYTTRTSIFPADKHLGPCIIERSTYIERALKDHLSDTST